MENQLKKSKPIGDILLDDMLQYPIWTWALDEEGLDGQDETWVKPILSENVRKEFIDVYILLKTENSDLYVLANLDVKKMTLSDINIWGKSEWLNIESCKNITYPLYMFSVPTIEENSNVKFIVENKNEKGKLLSNLRKRSFWRKMLKKYPGEIVLST